MTSSFEMIEFSVRITNHSITLRNSLTFPVQLNFCNFLIASNLISFGTSLFSKAISFKKCFTKRGISENLSFKEGTFISITANL